MTTNGDIVNLAQWLSPAFPVGGFAYSHGLETAIQGGTISRVGDLQDWLCDVLEYGSGRNDSILLRAAYACTSPAQIEEVNQTAIAVSASRERVFETQQQGTAFAQTVASIWGGGEMQDANSAALCYPVAVGYAATRAQFDVDLTATMYLHAFASNLVSAAVRAVPLGQTEGQRVLAALIPVCEQIVQRTVGTTLDDLSSTAFLSDIAAMQHETLQPRIFRS
ncbi:urease accessory protein [Sulfitobacter undariae]|uniref:Urease accessory protein UreF n=1 Tax=Sulfitobacter undariae TaxID=1563671 RepID=A0A7W6ED77_9RHOB|nr:urease accessory protein UreF [Sulfitobacter undariae]MBB3995639.1 urease accessory protein [Sulfitobacter undariae]